MKLLETPRLARRILIAGALVAIASKSVPGIALAADPIRYAGIEVGAKGVKAVVIDVGPSGAINSMEAISNTTLAQGVAKAGAFTDGAIQDTVEEVGKFAARIKGEFKVPAERISLIGSSGLPKASNREALAAALTAAAGVASMTFVTPADEVKYSIKGLLGDESERASALLVDVGSGNTKGGFLAAGAVLEFSIPFGSVSFENRVAADVARAKKPFAQVAGELRSTVLAPELARQVAAHPELTGRGIVFLSGGATYAMATLLKPEAVGEKRVDLTAQDIAAYAELVRRAPITSPKLAAIKGTPAEKEVKNVLDIFTPTNLIAGSEILSALATTLGLEGKTLRFDRTAVLALIRGKVLDQADADAKAKAVADAGADAIAADEAKVIAAKPVLTNPPTGAEPVAKPPKAPSKSLPEASAPANPR